MDAAGIASQMAPEVVAMGADRVWDELTEAFRRGMAEGDDER